MENVGIVSLETLRSVSGLEFFRGMAEGRYPTPPIAAELKMTLVSAERGAVTFRGDPAYKYYNPLGTVHGGWSATLLDTCMACAVHSMLEAGQGYTTLEFKVNFVKAILEDTGSIFALGKAINPGRTIATAEGRLVDGEGKLYAHATTTCMIFNGC